MSLLVVNGDIASQTFASALSKYDDAFKRFRTSQPVTLFSESFQNGAINDHLFTGNATGGATKTYNAVESAMDIAAPAGGRIFTQSKLYVPYQPGKSSLVIMSGNLGVTTINGCISRIGSFDNATDKTPTPTPDLDRGGDGHFFQLESIGGILQMSVAQRKTTNVAPYQTDTVISQTNWNIDTLDGSGPSGYILDPTESQVFFMDREWLGVGRVRMGFFMHGQPIYCHEFINANTFPSTYMKRASLPVRYELDNTLGAGAAAMKQICSTVSSEGGFTGRGHPFTASSPVAGKTISTTTLQPVISIRLKQDYRRVPVILNAFNALNNSSNIARVVLIYNGSLTGAVFNSVNANSTVEYDVSATAITGGEPYYSDTISSTNQITVNIAASFDINAGSILLTYDYDTTPDILTVAVEMNSVSGGVSINGTLNWIELI